MTPARWTAMRAALASTCILIHAVLVLELNFPGHLSVDSLMHLYEWHTAEQASFNPVFVTMWVGFTNHIWPEGGGAMLVSLMMHCATIWILVLAVPRFGWLCLAMVVIWCVWPVMLLYDGIVWKDVMFAKDRKSVV